jgi:hypothetical protein
MPRPLKPFSGGNGKRTGKGIAYKQRFGQMSRLQQQAANNLGVIMTDQLNRAKKFRSDDLELYDAYYEKRQYADLVPWDDAVDQQETYIPVRKRQPRINYNLAKVLCTKVASKLIGSSTFPKFVVEDDPEDTEFFRLVQKAVDFRRNLHEPIVRCLASGSSFARYYLVNGQFQMEWVNAKYCYPVFDDGGEELVQLEIRYVYEDPNDKDGTGKLKKKWYKMVLTQMADILFDNPDYQEGGEPSFKEVSRADHMLGWVQGEWLRTTKRKFSPDGDSLYGDILDFIDDLNYSLSQSSQAIAYNQEPQLTIKGIDEDEIDKLIRSSMKAISLGRDGEAKFLESELKSVEQAENNRTANRNRMLEVVRIVLHDPEKIVGNAQSGKALEVLHGPLIELIDELRTVFEPQLRRLLVKISMTMIAMDNSGFETALEIAPGYMPQSFDIVLQWPPIFPPTLDDIKNAVAAAAQAAAGLLVSRESMTRYLAPFFGIENIDEELEKISAQPVINPFGDMGGGGGF